MFSCMLYKFLKNALFPKHLRATVSGFWLAYDSWRTHSFGQILVQIIKMCFILILNKFLLLCFVVINLCRDSIQIFKDYLWTPKVSLFFIKDCSIFSQEQTHVQSQLETK